MSEQEVNLEKIFPPRRLSLLLQARREGDLTADALWKRQPREAKKQAFLAYLQGQPLDEISKAFGIPLSTIDSWCAGSGSSEAIKKLSSWRSAREDYELELVRAVMASKRDRIDIIIDDSLTALQKIVKHVAAQETPHPNHIKPLLGVITQLDKVTRLEDGKPTAINETRDNNPLSKEAILQKLREVDPFVDYAAKEDEPEPQVN